ncbi:hypothetical protein TELCIR_07188, partial [Teladorsagia circumcincta]
TTLRKRRRRALQEAFVARLEEERKKRGEVGSDALPCRPLHRATGSAVIGVSDKNRATVLRTFKPRDQHVFYPCGEFYLAHGRDHPFGFTVGCSASDRGYGLVKVYDKDVKEAVTAFREKYDKYVTEMERHGKKVPEPPHPLAVLPTHLTRFSGNHSRLYRSRKEARLSPTIDQQYSEFAPSNVASGDFYFGAGELTKTAIEKGIENPHYNDFTGLKDEAFALKPDLTKSMFMSMTTSDDDGHLEKEHIARMNWNPMQEVARLLRYHADQGDMQTCATLALVCGRRLSDVIDDFTVEAWKDSYIGMLDQLELHTAVAGVKKYSWIKRINQRSLEGTHFRLSHRGCTGQTLKCRCTKCYAVCGGTCSVCEGPLMKMNWFCRKCHHAGHPHHILEWFTTERTCPVGDCSCECGTTVVQSTEKRKAVAPKKTHRDLLRKRETNCYLPSTSSVKVQYESSSDDDSDSTTKAGDSAKNPSMPRFSIGKMPLGVSKSDSCQSAKREEKLEQQRSITLPIEHDLREAKKWLEESSAGGVLNVFMSTQRLVPSDGQASSVCQGFYPLDVWYQSTNLEQ